MALFCILIFFGTTAGNLATIIVAAVKAGPTSAADVDGVSMPIPTIY